MFIKLTNAADLYRGQPLVIRKNVILSVYAGLVEVNVDGEVGTEFQTIVYSTECQWQVEESVDQVFELLKE